MSTQPSATAAGTIEIGGDLTVNRLGFGAMRITGRGIWGEPPSRDQAIATLRRVVELGVNFIDTADSYGPEVSETLIAQALHPYPDDLVIATKGGQVRPGPNRWDPEGRPEHLREACEGSLRRLRLEQIPLYQLHRLDPKVPLAESIGAIATLKDEGKIRHVGVSNVTEDELREAQRIIPIVSIQNRFNVTDRQSQSLIDLCEQEDMVFLPWAPIQESSRRVAVAVAAERRGVTERQIALAWLLAISPATLPIPGTGSPEHAEENVAAAAIELSRDEIEAISKGGLSQLDGKPRQRIRGSRSGTSALNDHKEIGDDRFARRGAWVPAHSPQRGGDGPRRGELRPLRRPDARR
jgi:pyridoxine 4-dehydrogenase